MHFYFTLLFCLIFTFSKSQTKNEVEKRINYDEVPSFTIENLYKHVKRTKKVKWYYQTDGSKKVYEAKFMQSSQKYSIEFDTLGNISNVEVIIKKRQIPKKKLEVILSTLNSEFEDFKFQKIQREYLGEAQNLYAVLAKNKVDSDLTIRYEILINAKVDNIRKLYEIIFDNTGKILSKTEVIPQSTDILDY